MRALSTFLRLGGGNSALLGSEKTWKLQTEPHKGGYVSAAYLSRHERRETYPDGNEVVVKQGSGAWYTPCRSFLVYGVFRKTAYNLVKESFYG